jgi:glycosyltransferase involved in cell wall biosynthesis
MTPYPLSRIRIRSYGFVKHLIKQHSATVLALCTGKREEDDVSALQEEGFNIIPVYDERTAQALRSLRALHTRLPLQVAFCAAPALRASLAEQLASGQFDLLHVECVRALGVLPDFLPLPTIWDAVDCISQLYEQGAHHGATPMLRFIGQREARLTRAYELKQLQHFRHVLVTSERDRQALLEIAKSDVPKTSGKILAEITVLPHGVDRDYYQVYTGVRQPTTLVFSGKMSFHANIAGIFYFVKRILPLIWEKRPETRLIIAGSNPPASIRSLASDHRIEVTGYVPDLRPFIAQAQVAISPLPYAVGIQNKILEAMALGTPVVATSSATAGLKTITGRHLLVADEPEAFARQVLRLLADRILWNDLSQHGLAYIATHHNWEHITHQLINVYEKAIQTHERFNVRLSKSDQPDRSKSIDDTQLSTSL